MPSAEAFLRDVIDHPDDDGPRLVYADWLDEHDDPRGEFIRIQCQRTRLDEDDPRQEKLKAREFELSGEHEEGWDPEVRALAERVQYRRGFVECVEFDKASDFLKVARQLFELAPVGLVYIEAPFFGFSRWQRCPQLARLTGLKLGRFANRKWDASSLARAVAPPALSGLTELDVNNNYYLGEDWGLLLAAASHLNRLTTLLLSGNGLGAQGVRALAKARHLAGLRELDLRGNEIGPIGAGALARSPIFANLTKLLLGFDREFDDTNDLGDRGVRALVGSPHLTKLRVLDLSDNEIGDEGVLALAAWPGLAGVADLDLCGNAITDRGLRALASSQHAAGLRKLAVTANPVSDPGLRAVVDSKRLARMTKFNFEDLDDVLKDSTVSALERRFPGGYNVDLE
jgi:uncharacterized protein (TIGR02996 family)